MPLAVADPAQPRFTAVILTALETEYVAVLGLLTERRIVVGPSSGRDYREGRFHRQPDGTGEHAPWRVLIHEGGRDQMNALRATEDAARDWQPDAILFVGVAGGRPGKARHFEVIVGREIAYYETAKVTADGLRQWYKAAEAESSALFRAAKIERDETDKEGLPAWTGRVRRGPVANRIAAFGILEDLRARMAPIASGEKVVTDPDGALWKEIERSAYRVEAVETEGYGFSFARCDDLDRRPIPRLMIRGISDLMGDKNQTAEAARAGAPRRPAYLDELDDDERQRIASDAAAAFAFQVLVRFGDMYLEPTDKPCSAGMAEIPRLETFILKFHGDDPVKLRRSLEAVEHHLGLWGVKTFELDVQPGSLIATLQADPAAVAILRALAEARLLDRLAGVKTTILQAPPTAELEISDDLRAAANAIAELGAAEAERRDAAVNRLSALTDTHPEWRAAVLWLTILAGVTPARIDVSNQEQLNRLKVPPLPLTLVCWTSVSDLTPLVGLTELQTLYVSWTAVRDLVPLTGLTRLRTLDMRETEVTDLTPLAGLTGLQTLDATRAKITDLAPLAGLSKLRTLYASGTGVADLAPLAGLTRLRTLEVSQTQVTDLAPLAGLTGLQTLDVSRTQVTDLGPLAGLTGLQTLDVSQTQVTDLAPLAGLTGLRTLYLNGTRGTDLAPLAGLTKLQTLGLSNTKITDFTPLAGLTGLKELYNRLVQSREANRRRKPTDNVN